MRPTYWTPVFERIGKGLHAANADILKEPVPERWLDLINKLKAEEDALLRNLRAEEQKPGSKRT